MSNKIDLIIEHNASFDLLETFWEDMDEMKYYNHDITPEKFANGTLTSEEIEAITEALITGCECGATIKVLIDKNIDEKSLSPSSTYDMLGWNDPDAFEIFYPPTVATSDDPDYGYSLHKIGQYYILVSGFRQ